MHKLSNYLLSDTQLQAGEDLILFIEYETQTLVILSIQHKLYLIYMY